MLWDRVKNLAEEWTHEPFDEEIRSTVSTWLEEDNRDELMSASIWRWSLALEE